jgi:membrane protease subunit (stomatin/prohibitin family)
MAHQLYINLHSTAYPGGEIRGQLFQDNVVSFYADLKGSNEVPANTSTANGNTIATFNKDTKILTVVTSYSGMVVTAGHIHKEVAGSNGPVVFPFTTTASPIVFTSVALNTGQETDLMANLYYVNLHSTAYSDGEIRGQLIKHP